jgi:hypothetical protein
VEAALYTRVFDLLSHPVSADNIIVSSQAKGVIRRREETISELQGLIGHRGVTKKTIEHRRVL